MTTSDDRLFFEGRALELHTVNFGDSTKIADQLRTRRTITESLSVSAAV